MGFEPTSTRFTTWGINRYATATMCTAFKREAWCAITPKARNYALTIHPRWHTRAVAYDSGIPRTGHSLKLAVSKPTANLHLDSTPVATPTVLS